MLMKFKFKILILSIIVIASCQSQERYIYENIKSDINLYLHNQMFNDFAQSDTLVIYDTSYFNDMTLLLGTYQNQLVGEDSMYNQLINERLGLIEVEKIQTRQPDIYLPFEVLKENLNENNTEKIMTWLTNVPKQFEAAKVQLEKTNRSNTELAIKELKTAYNFISTDLIVHLDTLDQSEKYAKVIDNTKFAIKDYLAFLNSKLINQETD